jgi:hypothetical protein
MVNRRLDSNSDSRPEPDPKDYAGVLPVKYASHLCGVVLGYCAFTDCRPLDMSSLGVPHLS